MAFLLQKVIALLATASASSWSPPTGNGQPWSLSPRESGRVEDRFLKCRCRDAACDNVKQVAVFTVIGHSPLVGYEEDRARGGTDSLDFGQAEFPGV